MAKKPTVTTVASGYYGRQALNDNFEALRDAFDNTLSRDGSTPNAMGADFDVNGYRILNAGQIDTDALYLNGVAITSASDVEFQTTYLTASYTGNGSTVAYSLTANPQSEGNVSIYVDGVYQNKDTFSLSGTTVTFSEAPPLNAAIEIVYPTNTDTLNGSLSSAITYNQGGTGAQDRTVKAKLQETVSVKDFGAVGDGVTDDTAAIQAAIDAVVSNDGGEVFFPYGVYVLSSTVNLANARSGSTVTNLTLTGCGSKLDVTAINTNVLTFDYVDNLTIRNFEIVGDASNTSNVFIKDIVIDPNASAETYSYRVIIENIDATNIGTFSDFSRVRSAAFRDIKIASLAYGFRFTGKCNETSIINCVAFSDEAALDLYTTTTAGGVSFVEGIYCFGCTFELTLGGSESVRAAVRITNGQDISLVSCWFGNFYDQEIDGSNYVTTYALYASRGGTTEDAQMVGNPKIQNCNIYGARLFVNNRQGGFNRGNYFNISNNTFYVRAQAGTNPNIDFLVKIDGSNIGCNFSNNTVTCSRDIDAAFIFEDAENLIVANNSISHDQGTPTPSVTCGTVFTYDTCPAIQENGNVIDIPFTTLRSMTLSRFYDTNIFVPTIAPQTSGTITLDATGSDLEFTKQGRLVFISGMLTVSSVASPVGDYITLGNLPFTTADLSDFSGRFSGSVSHNDGAGVFTQLPVQGRENLTDLRIYIDASTISANHQFYISITYIVSDAE